MLIIQPILVLDSTLIGDYHPHSFICCQIFQVISDSNPFCPLMVSSPDPPPAPPSSNPVLVIRFALKGCVLLLPGSFPYKSGVNPAARKIFSAASADPPKVARALDKKRINVSRTI